MKVFAVNLLSSLQVLWTRVRSASYEEASSCATTILERISLFLFKVAVDTALTQEINLNLKPARLSPRLRVSPSLRLGTRQTLPL
jgi:hypothetical protein